MAKYIEAGRLREAFLTDLQHLQSIDEHTADLILTELEEAPPADVAPVVHGRWVDEDFPEKMASVHGFAVCSVCKELSHKAEHGYNILSDYCPNCGAKMYKNTQAHRMAQRLKERFCK